MDNEILRSTQGCEMNSGDRELVSTREACLLLGGIDRKLLAKFVHAGQLVRYRISNSKAYRYDKKQILGLIRQDKNNMG